MSFKGAAATADSNNVSQDRNQQAVPSWALRPSLGKRSWKITEKKGQSGEGLKNSQEKPVACHKREGQFRPSKQDKNTSTLCHAGGESTGTLIQEEKGPAKSERKEGGRGLVRSNETRRGNH